MLPKTYHHRRTGWHRVRGTGADDLCQMQSAFEPVQESLQRGSVHQDVGNLRSGGLLECGKAAGKDLQLAVDDSMLVGVETSWRRAGGVSAIGVVDATVARTHEQLGFGEPSHRTAQVRTIDCEHRE